MSITRTLSLLHPWFVALFLSWLFTLLLAFHEVIFPTTVLAQAASSIGDGGPTTGATLVQAGGLAIDLNGNIYIAETGAHRVRKITSAGIITTVAGTGVAGFGGDGGPAVSASLNAPYGLAVDTLGNLYIADLGNTRVRRISLDGTISTVAGGGTLAAGGANEGGSATDIALVSPRNLAIDASGGLYIADFGGHRVFRLSITGTLTTVAGTGTAGNAGDGGTATNAQLAYPAGLAWDSQSTLYIADSQNHSVRRVINGIMTTVQAAIKPTGVVIDSAGALWVADPGAQTLSRYLPSQSSTTPKGFQSPPQQKFFATSSAITRGSNLDIYAVDDVLNQVWRIFLTGSTQRIAGLSATSSNPSASSPSTSTPNPSTPATSGSSGDPVSPTPSTSAPSTSAPSTTVPSTTVPSTTVPVTSNIGPTISVLNGASLLPAPIAPGMLVTLRGAGIPGADVLLTQVFINSTNAPIVSMSDTEIRIQAPLSLVAVGNVDVKIVHNGSIAAAFSTPAAAAAPALFDSTDASMSPVARSSVVPLFGTGLGLGDLPVTLAIGGVAAQVVSLNPSAGYPGLFQLKAVVPMTAPSGNVGVTLSVGDAISPAGAQIAIQ